MSQSNDQINVFREQILNAANNKTSLSIEGGGTKSWYGNSNGFTKLNTLSYSGILEYQPEELVITACAGTPLKKIESDLKEKIRYSLSSLLILVIMQPSAAQLLLDWLSPVVFLLEISETLY